MKTRGLKKVVPPPLEAVATPIVPASEPVQVDISLEVARKILPALLLWVGDSMLPHLHVVHFESKGGVLRVMSTNGHGLYVVDVGQCSADFKFSMRVEDVNTVLALARMLRTVKTLSLSFVSEVTCKVRIGRAGVDATNWEHFPDWRRVCGEEFKAERAKLVAMDPRYLGKISKCLPSRSGVKVATRGALEPVRFDGEIAGLLAFVILMPMQVG